MCKGVEILAFYIAWAALSSWAVIRLLIYKREPSSTWAWLLFSCLVPIIGALSFLIFGPQRLERIAVNRKKQLHQIVSQYKESDEFTPSLSSTSLNELSSDHVFKLAQKISEYEATGGNNLEILGDPPATLQRMQEVIRHAKHFIHLEYYIIASDEVTEELFGDLTQAAMRGVEVRILYDALGSLALKRRYFVPLIKHGVKIAGFLPFSLLPKRLNFNFRNHRKILIVDGLIAFIGGNNIGKEYLGRRTEHQWRDFSVQVEGPSVLQLQDVFAKDWLFTTKEDLFTTKYYPKPLKHGETALQVLESGPDTAFRNLHHALFLALNSSKKHIYLTTPYFIPDSSIMESLLVAALRGVDVQILLPLKSDSRLVQYASRSFYDPLLEAGAKISRYQPQILHAKMLTIDHKWTFLGSANMDIRSFRLNFEITLLAHGNAIASSAEKIFKDDLAQSLSVEREAFKNRPLSQQMVENACRLLSPVL